MTEDTYRGTNAYFLIDGHRYRGDGDEYTMLDSRALAALKKGALITFSWIDWPYRSEIENKDVLAGFEVSYNECAAFLRD